MGGIRLQEVCSDEVILVGTHRGKHVIVLGTKGTEEAWGAATSVLDTFLSEAGWAAEAIVVDVLHASVRGTSIRDGFSAD